MSVLAWALQNTVVAGGMALAVIVICRVLKPSPTWSHALWLVVLIKLVTPPLVEWPWALPEAPLAAESRSQPPAPQESDGHAADRRGEPGMSSGAEEGPDGGRLNVEQYVLERELLVAPRPQDSGETGSQAVEARPETARRESDRFSAALLIAWLWAAGGCTLLALQAVQVYWMDRRLRRTRGEVPRELEALVVRMSNRLGVRPPRVRSANVSSPLLWSLLVPQLVWPVTLCRPDSWSRWEGVVLHELAHVKRRDHWVGWLELVAACVWWWNPLFWYVRHQLREHAELACDAWVVAAAPEARRSYAEALILVCASSPDTCTPLPARGVGDGGRRAFRRRLKMVLRESPSCRVSRGGMVALLVLVVLALPGWSQTRQSEPIPGEGQTRQSDPLAVQPPAAPTDYPETAQDPNAAPVTPSTRLSSPAEPVPATDPQPAYVANPEPAQDPILLLYENPYIANQGHGTRVPTDVRTVQEMQRRIALLMTEVAQLRAQLPETPADETHATVAQGAVRIAEAEGQEAIATTPSDPSTPIARTITLERTTYRLSQDKAEALARFLQTQVSEETLTARVTTVTGPNGQAEEAITITAKPEAQRAIGMFIAFLAEAPAPPSLPPSDAIYGNGAADAAPALDAFDNNTPAAASGDLLPAGSGTFDDNFDRIRGGIR